MERESIRRNLINAFTTLRRRWVWALPVFLISFLYSVIIIRRLPVIYRATSVVVVRNAPTMGGGVAEALSASGLSLPRGGGINQGQRVSLDATARQVRSRKNWPEARQKIAAWRDRNGAHLSPPMNEDEYFSTLAVDTEGPDQLLVHGISEDPVRATAVSHVAANVAESASINDARSDWKRVVEYASRALPSIEREMDNSRREMADYERKHKLYDAMNASKNLAQQFGANLAELNRARAMESAARRQLDAIQSNYQNEADVQVLRVPEEDPILIGMREQLSKAQGELIRSRTDFEEGSPEVDAAKDQVSQAQALLRQHIGKTVSMPKGLPNHRKELLYDSMVRAQSEMLASQATADAYQQMVRENQRDLDSLSRKFAGWQSIYQRSKVRESSYLVFLSKMQEAMVSAAVEPGDLQLVDLAGYPPPVIGVSHSRLLFFATLLSLLLACGTAFLVDFVGDTVSTPQEAQRLTGVPVLGVLPPGNEVQPELALVNQPQSQLAEAVWMASVNLKQASRGKIPRTILITSPQDEDGKSTTAASLALALSRSGQSVVLVDADLRNSDMHRIFPSGNSEGLVNVVDDEKPVREALQAGPVRNLKILHSGSKTVSPPEIFDSAPMARLLEECRSQFDVVVIDSPPLLGLADSRLLTAQADATLLVARAGRTRRSALSTSRHIIDAAGGRLAGVILNMARDTEFVSQNGSSTQGRTIDSGISPSKPIDEKGPSEV